jgi:hypothetical protein
MRDDCRTGGAWRGLQSGAAKAKTSGGYSRPGRHKHICCKLQHVQRISSVQLMLPAGKELQRLPQLTAERLRDPRRWQGTGCVQ